MPRTKQTARKSAGHLAPSRSNFMNVDGHARAQKTQRTEAADEQGDDTAEHQVRPRSQSEHLEVNHSLSVQMQLDGPRSTPSPEVRTEPKYHPQDYATSQSDTSNTDNGAPVEPSLHAMDTSGRDLTDLASPLSEETIRKSNKGQDGSSQISEETTGFYSQTAPTGTSFPAASPQEEVQTEEKVEDVKSIASATHSKKRILVPDSEEGQNESRIKKSKMHPVDQVVITKSSVNKVEPAQEVANKHSADDGAKIPGEPIETAEPADEENGKKLNGTSVKTNQDFTNGAFLDFETIPGSPIQGFNAESLNEECSKMADEHDKKLTAIWEEWQHLNGKIETWLVRGVQMQGAREDCLISHKLQEVNKSVDQATKQRDELVGFCRQMQKAFSMFFPETM